MSRQNVISELNEGFAASSNRIIKTAEGYIFGWGTTAGNGVESWAPGATFVHTDGDNNIQRVYINTGTSTTAVWTSLFTDYTKQPTATNYVTASGSNNALTATLQDATGTAIPLAAGLEIKVNTSTLTLQSGANTIALNGGSAKSIKKHTNKATDITGGYAAGSIVHLMYDGTQFQDMSQ